MKTRQLFATIISPEAQERIKNNQCPGCGKPKEEWKRNTKWRCCSKECTKEYVRNMVTFGWPDLRMEAIKRDSYTCKLCGKKHETKKGLIVDHIIPIAIGGEQWDINNLQTLCQSCNKAKTKIDIQKIARQRRIEKALKRGQSTIGGHHG